MSASTDAQAIHTADELAARPKDLGPCELVRGELIEMVPTFHEHMRTESRLLILLGQFLLDNNLGEVYPGDCGFLLERNPDTVRSPDVAFVKKDRLRDESYEGYFPGAPDLAVEILSASNTTGEMMDKVAQYLASGAQVVWLVDPASRTVTIYRQEFPITLLHEDDTLTEPGLLPGFETPVGALFPNRKDA